MRLQSSECIHAIRRCLDNAPREEANQSAALAVIVTVSGSRERLTRRDPVRSRLTETSAVEVNWQPKEPKSLRRAAVDACAANRESHRRARANSNRLSPTFRLSSSVQCGESHWWRQPTGNEDLSRITILFPFLFFLFVLQQWSER